MVAKENKAMLCLTYPNLPLSSTSINSTLKSKINVGLHLLIFGLFSRGFKLVQIGSEKIKMNQIDYLNQIR